MGALYNAVKSFINLVYVQKPNKLATNNIPAVYHLPAQLVDISQVWSKLYDRKQSFCKMSCTEEEAHILKCMCYAKHRLLISNIYKI